MQKKILIGCAIISFASILCGFIWKIFDPRDYMATDLYFFGWLSSLLVVGYYSTPSDSIYGKILFVFIVIMVGGILIKVMHWEYANEIIIFSLAGITGTYLVKWLKERVA
jgi:hypothetical protein